MARKLIELTPADLRVMLADFALWYVHTPTTADLHERYQVSFWDAMILQRAARLGSPVIWSEDLNAGQWYGSVRVVNPFVTESNAPMDDRISEANPV